MTLTGQFHAIVETEARSRGMRCSWEVRRLAKSFKELGCEGDRRGKKIRKGFVKMEGHRENLEAQMPKCVQWLSVGSGIKKPLNFQKQSKRCLMEFWYYLFYCYKILENVSTYSKFHSCMQRCAEQGGTSCCLCWRAEGLAWSICNEAYRWCSSFCISPLPVNQGCQCDQQNIVNDT